MFLRKHCQIRRNRSSIQNLVSLVCCQPGGIPGDFCGGLLWSLGLRHLWLQGEPRLPQHQAQPHLHSPTGYGAASCKRDGKGVCVCVCLLFSKFEQMQESGGIWQGRKVLSTVPRAALKPPGQALGSALTAAKCCYWAMGLEQGVSPWVLLELLEEITQ